VLTTDGLVRAVLQFLRHRGGVAARGGGPHVVIILYRLNVVSMQVARGSMQVAGGGGGHGHYIGIIDWRRSGSPGGRRYYIRSGPGNLGVMDIHMDIHIYIHTVAVHEVDSEGN
jgi:hypothetical protein